MKTRPKRSSIWAMPKDDFFLLFTTASSMGEVLAAFGFNNKGGNYKTIIKRCKEENIPYIGVFTHNKGKGQLKPFIDISEMLIEGSTHSRSNLKRRIIKENIIDYKCECCGLGNVWKDKNIVLILDHINGICDDNRVENLRFLCPNCNSQTDTFSGKNRSFVTSRASEKSGVCPCGSKTSVKDTKCASCFNTNRATKIAWPNIEDLKQEVKSTNINKVAKRLGVSFTAVKKRLIKFNI